MSLGESVTVSLFPLRVDLSAPGVLLRPPALVMLSRDAVKAHCTSNVCLQTAVAGIMMQTPSPNIW